MARKRLVRLYRDSKRNYEICLILHQRLSEGDFAKKIDVIKGLIQSEITVQDAKFKAEVVDVVSTKIRSFAYAIDNKGNAKGYYVCVYTKADPSIVEVIRRKLILESDVLRVLVILANPKKQSYGIFSSQYETDSYKSKNKFYSYDDPNMLSKFLGEGARINEKRVSIGKNISKNLSKKQRSVAKVIKTARYLSLLPYRED